MRPSATSLLLALTVAGVSALVAASVLTASGATEAMPGRVALHVLAIATPALTGLYATRHRESERFGHLLLGAALIWSLALLAESPNALLYSTGRLAAWMIFPVLVYLMLAFPAGRLTRRPDRILVGGIGLVVVLLHMGSALVSQDYPASSPWASCDADCPPNAFLVLASEPAVVGAVIEPARDALAAALLIGVTVSLAQRMRGASVMWRMTAAPLVVVSILTTLVLVAFILVRRFAPESAAADAIGVSWALSLPAITAAFWIGLLQRRLLMADMLSRLSRSLPPHGTSREVAAALRSAMCDPAVTVLHRDVRHGTWRREDGTVADLPALGRLVRQIDNQDGPVAAVVTDPDADPDDDLMEAVVTLTEGVLREVTLQRELDASLTDLEDSRKRIATAAEIERKRIERDLHDGAQQRLIALRMRLSLAEDLLQDDPQSATRTIRSLGADVDQALEEIRSLARGIYPSLLADRGLVDALWSAGRRCPIPVHVRATNVTRHRPEIESAVYFSCVEALQNAVKHARGATRVSISLRDGEVLEFDVADDGEGFDVSATRPDAGLRNMHDRVESLGGTLIVLSSRDGTRVHGTVPLETLPETSEGVPRDVPQTSARLD